MTDNLSQPSFKFLNVFSSRRTPPIHPAKVSSSLHLLDTRGQAAVTAVAALLRLAATRRTARTAAVETPVHHQRERA